MLAFPNNHYKTRFYVREPTLKLSVYVLISRVGGIWKRLCGYLFLLSILGIIIDVSVIFVRKIFNKKIKNQPYDFDYEAELFVYKNIGRDKKEKVVKSLKSNFQIPNVYTEWREQLTKRNEKIKDNENFYHFIKRCLRKAEKNSEFLSAITVPVEIALLTVLPTFDGSLIEKMITLLVCTGVLAFVISWKFCKRLISGYTQNFPEPIARIPES